MPRFLVRPAASRVLDPSLHWSLSPAGSRGRWARGRRAAPFTLVYLAASWALFVPAAKRSEGHYSIDEDRVAAYIFRIPDLSENRPRAVRSLATAPWLNHDDVQLVYVTLLLLLFGLRFEAREGTRTTVLLFFGTTLAGAVGAGSLLHLLYPGTADSGFLAHAWGRTWSGGSAGSFGVMGAMAARARRPWLLLGLFATWEVTVVTWYLRQYTPAFHLSALTTGFVAMRYAEPFVRRCLSRLPGRGAQLGRRLWYGP